MIRISGLIVLGMTLGCGSASTVAPPQSDPLSLQLSAPASASVGTAIRLTLTLKNTTKQPVQVMLGGRPPTDFVVTTPEGAEVWRWSTDQVVQAILEVRTLQPGEQLEYNTEWNLKHSRGTLPSPGRYLVKGILNMDPPETLETTPRELVLNN
jgi:hypothetical protein